MSLQDSCAVVRWVDIVAGHTCEGVGSGQRCTATVQLDGVQMVCGRYWSEIEHCGPAAHLAPEDQPEAITRAIVRWANRHRLR